MTSDELAELMRDSGLMPTQPEVWAGNIADYARQMRNGTWDSEHTANDVKSPMIRDTVGNIVAGHHRFIAAHMVGIAIPAGVVKFLPGTTKRVPRPWQTLVVNPGKRP